MPLRDVKGRFRKPSGADNWTHRSCTTCARLVRIDTITILSTGRYCRRCIPRQARCADCDRVRYIPEMVQNQGVSGWSCPSCVTNRKGCSECGKPMPPRETMCQKCMKLRFYCIGCDHNFGPSQYGGSSRCLKCKGKQRIVPQPRISGQGGNALDTCFADPEVHLDGNRRVWHRLFGIELEMEVPGGFSGPHDREAIGRQIYELVKGDAIVKGDGSLDYGIEMATRPMNYHNHIKFWDKFDEGRPKALQDSSRCGLHIHVSRRSMTELTINKLGVFLNDPKHKKLMVKIARRYNVMYAQRCNCTLTKPPIGRGMLNAKSRHGTIELRLFRGTMKKTEIIAALEFTKTAIEFCETTSYRDITDTKYLEFLSKQPKLHSLKAVVLNQYPHERSTMREAVRV